MTSLAERVESVATLKALDSIGSYVRFVTLESQKPSGCPRSIQ